MNDRQTQQLPIPRVGEANYLLLSPYLQQNKAKGVAHLDYKSTQASNHDVMNQCGRHLFNAKIGLLFKIVVVF